MRLFLFITFFSLRVGNYAQRIQFPLTQSSAIHYHQHILVYGFLQTKNYTIFKCYSFSEDLKLKDSIIHPINKRPTEDFLPIQADTLHQYINFYFQLSDQKNTVTLLRLNEKLKLICFEENVDANHVNTIAAFDQEKYFFGPHLYTIRTSGDSLNKQYYLTKHTIQSSNKHFEYDINWQYPFEKKYIHDAIITYVNSNMVLVYVNVADSIKQGQWILKINAKTGELIRGTKLNSKGQNNHYLLSNLFYLPSKKEFMCLGNVYQNKEVNFKTEEHTFTNTQKNHVLFVINMDSMGNITSRNEFLLPIPVTIDKSNMTLSYHFKIREVSEKTPNTFVLWADVFQLNSNHILSYYSSWPIQLENSESNYQIYPSPFFSIQKIIPDLISTNTNQLFDEILVDNNHQYIQFLVKNPVKSPLLFSFLDNSNQPHFIFSKKDIEKKEKDFISVFANGKNISRNTLSEKTSFSSQLFRINEKKYIQFEQKENAFILKLSDW